MRKNMILTIVGALCVLVISASVQAGEEAAPQPVLPDANYLSKPVTFTPSTQPAPYLPVPTTSYPPAPVVPTCVLPAATITHVPMPEAVQAMQAMRVQLIAAYFEAFGEAFSMCMEAEKGLLSGEMELVEFLQVKLHYLNAAIRLYRECDPSRVPALLEERVETAELYVKALEKGIETLKDNADARALPEKCLEAAKYIRDTAKKEWEKSQPVIQPCTASSPFSPVYTPVNTPPLPPPVSPAVPPTE